MSEFRQAVVSEPTAVAETPKAEVKATTTEHAPELVATYSEDMGKPYVAKYMDIEGVWDKEPTMALEVKTIESFIQNQVKKGDLDNSTRATDKYLKEIEKKAGLTGYETATKRISAILAYIDFKKVIDG